MYVVCAFNSNKGRKLIRSEIIFSVQLDIFGVRNRKRWILSLSCRQNRFCAFRSNVFKFAQWFASWKSFLAISSKKYPFLVYQIEYWHNNFKLLFFSFCRLLFILSFQTINIRMNCNCYGCEFRLIRLVLFPCSRN